MHFDFGQLYGFSTFLPTIIQEIGHWSSATVQVVRLRYNIVYH